MRTPSITAFVGRAWRALLVVALLAGLLPQLLLPAAAQSPTFTDLGDLGIQEYAEDLAWGDYDNDGDLDILWMTFSETRILRNDGGSFAEVYTALPGVATGAVAWGDYDSDGDLDVLLSGYSRTEGITRVYRNDGNDTFVDIEAGLPGLYESSVAWGDYDNDGRLDILLSGTLQSPALTMDVTRIYHNDGDGTFSRVYAGLRGANNGSVAWSDYDADGDLDIVVTGTSLRSGSQIHIASIYRNDGDGSFVDIGAPLFAVQQSSTAWGDYDSDGDLDLLLAGHSYDGDVAKVYRNDGNDTFVDAGAGLPGVFDSSLAWGDYDNDGDLDILLVGSQYDEYNGGTCVTRVYRNDGGTFADIDAGLIGLSESVAAWADFDNDGDLDIVLSGQESGTQVKFYRNDASMPNTPPAAPGELTASVAGGGITLGWQPAVDAQTPAAGLSYNLRVGTTPGAGDVLSPMAGGAGWRRVVQMGGAGPGLTARLSLPAGIYYWSVQAVDSAFAGGAFAAEGSFTSEAAPATPPAFTAVDTGLLDLVGGPTAWGDYDSDGDLDLFLSGGYYGDAELFGGSLLMQLYTNNGDGTLSDSQIALRPSGLVMGSAAWGDYDNDRDLDLLLTGGELQSYLTAVTSLYRNDGGSSFADANDGVTNQLADMVDGSATWADYDLDGDLDILLAGGDWEGYTLLYRNEGDGSFADAQAGLPGLEYAAAAWGDYDNDGDPDILLTGQQPGSFFFITRVYRNDGDGTFTDIGAGLPGVGRASVAWGDYDSDGWLDILLAGSARDAYGSEVPVTSVYRNNGDGSFADIAAGLPGIEEGSVGWGDYDDDGDLDILLTGRLYTMLGPQPAARVYRNDGNGVFVEVDAGLPDVEFGSASWADYDNDGDLDILLTGRCNNETMAMIYRNDLAGANAAPAAPSGLRASVAGTSVSLAWDAAADAETPAAGLHYNLRVGTAPGSDDVVSPMADDASGWRRIVGLGNAHPTTTRLSLPAGTYYWSVQAIDTAWAGGPFAAEQSFTVGPVVLPAALAITGPTEGLSGVPYTFTASVSPPDASIPLTYTWQAEGQAPLTHTSDSSTDTATFTWSATGPQAITVTASNAGGTVTATQAIAIYAVPVASFDAAPSAGVAPLAVSFANTSTGSYTSSLWDFGDGITSTLAGPAHTYTAPGVYTVTLTVDGPAGADTAVRPACITVYTPVEADFAGTPTSGVAPLSVSFSNASTGDYDALTWDFGDGSAPSTETDPTHVYAAPGVYSVSLTADGPGGTDTEVKAAHVSVYAPVEAAFSATPTVGVAPLSVAFSNESSGDYVTSAWDFGDGVTSTEADPTHVYAAPGVYTVTLTVGGPGGTDTETRTDYVAVHAPLQAAFSATPASGIAPLTVAFANNSTGEYTSCEWDLGDGTTSTIANPTHTYTAGGVYTVTLTVSGPYDTDTTVGYVTVYVPVQAAFTATPAGSLTVAFANTSQGDYTSALWDFGDGTTSTEMNPVYTYSRQGVFTVTLTVSGSGGTSSAAEIIRVKKNQ